MLELHSHIAEGDGFGVYLSFFQATSSVARQIDVEPQLVIIDQLFHDQFRFVLLRVLK